MYKYNNNNIIITIITLVLYNIIILHDGGFDLRWQQRLNEKLYSACTYTPARTCTRWLDRLVYSGIYGWSGIGNRRYACLQTQTGSRYSERGLLAADSVLYWFSVTRSQLFLFFFFCCIGEVFQVKY